MIRSYSNIEFINLFSKHLSKESVYKEEEIAWCMDVIYSRIKNKQKTIESIKTVIIRSANKDINTLFSLYNKMCETGLIIPINVRRKTYLPNPTNPKDWIDKVLKDRNIIDNTILNF